MLRRVLITLDAVGGVWRYAIDVARGLEAHGVDCLLVGFGPEPDAAQRAECGRSELVWTHEPLDWMVSEGAALDRGTDMLASLARDWNADVLHLNLPSQACGLPDRVSRRGRLPFLRADLVARCSGHRSSERLGVADPTQPGRLPARRCGCCPQQKPRRGAERGLRPAAAACT